MPIERVEGRFGFGGVHAWSRLQAGAVAAVVLTVLPLAVAAVRAAAGPWIPIRDDAYFTARSLDVATNNHPLLGAWSAGSLDVRTPVNNLGPTQLDLLAPFTRFTPMGGTAVGVVVVHIAAIVTVAWLMWRIAGPRFVPPTMAATAIVGWSLGSEMLITPQQHQYLVLPYLCVLVAAWGVTSGDRWALVPAVVFGSLAAQTHLSYPILLAALGAPMIIGQVLAFRRRSSTGESNWSTPLVVSGLLVVVLWSQTAIDQFVGFGNFADVLASGGEASAPSTTTALRIVADVVTSPAGFLRPGYGEFDPETTVGSNAQVVVLIFMCVGLTTGLVIALRRGHRRAAAGLGVAAVTLWAAVVNASILPITAGFGLLPSNYRWLWAIVAFLLVGTFCLIVQIAPRLSIRHGATVTNGVLALVLVGSSIANLPRSIQVPNAQLYLRDQEATADLLRQLEAVPLEGPVIIDQDDMYLGHPYTYPILTVLTERGIEYRFESPLQARRFGVSRVADGTETQRLELSFGDVAAVRRDLPSTVGFVDGTPPVALSLVPEPDST